jgi:hypothetical protein
MRLIAEAYYKQMWDLVSYDLDNVRIRYAGVQQLARLCHGIDVRLNGEFVKGAESWVNLSLLRTREAIDGVQHQIRNLGDREGRPVKMCRARPTASLPSRHFFRITCAKTKISGCT